MARGYFNHTSPDGRDGNGTHKKVMISPQRRRCILDRSISVHTWFDDGHTTYFLLLLAIYHYQKQCLVLERSKRLRLIK